MGHSPAKNLRALSLRICWLSLSPNCMVISSRLSTTPLKRRGTEEAEKEEIAKSPNCQNLRPCCFGSFPNYPSFVSSIPPCFKVLILFSDDARRRQS